jgi:E3 ubiquitin-protein ligase HERC1
MLGTALDVVNSLPPLSLANESQLSALGSETLTSVSNFLAHTAQPDSGASQSGILFYNFKCLFLFVIMV